jgi:hypothetical protein
MVLSNGGSYTIAASPAPTTTTLTINSPPAGGTYTYTLTQTPNLNNLPTNTEWWTLIGATSNTSGGCSINGFDGTPKGSWSRRWQYEYAVATSVNAGTGAVTLLNPIQMPNYGATGANPMVWINQPEYQIGIENMSMDSTALGAASRTDFINIRDCYQCWVTGNRFIDQGAYGIFAGWSSNLLIEQNYFYNAKGPQASNDPYTIRFQTVGNGLIQNNIFQLIRAQFVTDGPSSANVIGYNFSVNDATTSGNLWFNFWEHDTTALNLFEGNVGIAIRGDQFHGGHLNSTLFRNFETGWASCANGQCGSATQKDTYTLAVLWDDYTRYGHFVGNIFGTPGYHTGYITNSSYNHNIYGLAIPNNTPTDPLVQSTAMFWGNWDSKTAATRWCGNSSDSGWSAICGSVSEIPTGAPVYPNPVPTVGDVNATPPQPALPASFYLTAKPSWFMSVPFPPIGPDVTGGNVGQCSGTMSNASNAGTSQAGLPATANSQCAAAQTINTAAWGGHINANPAMNCYLNTMGGNPDGTNGLLPFDASSCYSPGSSSATLLPLTLAFGNQNINTTSIGQVATLTNTGTNSLTVVQAQLFGSNFTLTNLGSCFTTYGSNTSFTLPVGLSCTFVITFSPTATIAYSGTFQVTDNAVGSPQIINLTGQGTVPIITWSSPQGGTTYNYGNVLVGSFSNSSPLTLQNTGTGPLNVALTVTGTNAAQFVIQSTTCSSTLAAGSSCTIVVRFTPGAAQSYTAFLTETDSIQSLTANLTLNGTGLAPPVQIIAPAPWIIIM